MVRIALTAAALVAALLLAPAGAHGAYENPYPAPYPAPSPSPAGEGSARVVKRAANEKLGHRVLTDIRGRTLYSLSSERNASSIPRCW